MKLTCDVCAGTLQMMEGGQGAICTNCGVTYSVERLREKLGANTSNHQNYYQPNNNYSYESNYGSDDLEPPKTSWQQPSSPKPNRYLYIKRLRDFHLCKFVAIIDGEYTYEIAGAGKVTTIPVSYGTHTINIQVANTSGISDVGSMSFEVTDYDWYGEVGLSRGAFKASYEYKMAEQR